MAQRVAIGRRKEEKHYEVASYRTGAACRGLPSHSLPIRRVQRVFTSAQKVRVGELVRANTNVSSILRPLSLPKKA